MTLEKLEIKTFSIKGTNIMRKVTGLKLGLG